MGGAHDIAFGSRQMTEFKPGDLARTLWGFQYTIAGKERRCLPGSVVLVCGVLAPDKSWEQVSVQILGTSKVVPMPTTGLLPV